MASTLKLVQYPWSVVFRVITDHAELDPQLSRVLGPRLRSWKGEEGDKAPLTATEDGPVMRFTPHPRSVSRYDPLTEYGPLDVLVEFSVLSLDITDTLNLWGAVCDALTFRDEAFRMALVDAGAETGEIVFGTPAFDPKPEAKPEGVFNAAGVFSLSVLRSIQVPF
jgi:hypothetical protein